MGDQENMDTTGGTGASTAGAEGGRGDPNSSSSASSSSSSAAAAADAAHVAAAAEEKALKDKLGMGDDWGDDDEDDDDDDDDDGNINNSSSGNNDGGNQENGHGEPTDIEEMRRQAMMEMEEDEDDEEGGDEDDEDQFPFHDAIENGDLERARNMLALHLTNDMYLERKNLMLRETEPERREKLASIYEREQREKLLGKRDHESCNPLHVAILSQKYECMEFLLKNGARLTAKCNNAPLTHLILGVGSIKAHQEFAFKALKLVLKYSNEKEFDVEKIDITAKDDLYRTVLHLAAEFNFPKAIEAMKTDSKFDLLWNIKDMEGNTAVHIACRTKALEVLTELVKEKQVIEKLDQAQNFYKSTALHVAALSNFVDGSKMLVAANSKLRDARNARDETALDVAKKFGSVGVVNFLESNKSDDSSSSSGTKKKKTALLWHDICMRHYTCPPRCTAKRGYYDVPPENVNRIKVLIDENLGILRSTRLNSMLEWQKATKANIADVLRVHDYSYVSKISNFCDQLSENQIGELDADTTISGLSWDSALFAAGSVCDAIDKVCQGEYRNAFCAVRPPGHHSGPRGVVTSKLDPHGSYGFCLLSNAAIGAAYARHLYRHQGIRKVAIVDFDVHHGNGTEACVKNMKPNLVTANLKSPFANVELSHQSFKPWLNEEDCDNVFFASIHGFGKRAPGFDPDPMAPPRIGMFYPSDGANYGFGGYEKPGPGDPKIVDVGQNSKSRMEWRSNWRKYVLPSLASFGPDLIIISAGFDAHKLDDINMGYISALEQDYYWLTRQLVRIANTSGKGRVVSVLEGGYKIQGRIVSPFARSVCAHVAALTESTDTEKYDVEDAKWEENYEVEMLLRAREQRLAASALAAAQSSSSSAAAASSSSSSSSSSSTSSVAKAENESVKTSDAPVVVDAETSGPERKRSRRSSQGVDYKALNEKLNKEVAEKKKAAAAVVKN